MSRLAEGPEDTGAGKVLVVDDSELELKLARTRLERAGYRVLTSTTGNCAQIVMRERPDLILMDVNLPGVQGDIAARMLLLGQGTDRSTIIVLYSSLPPDQLEAKVRATGVAGFISKGGDEPSFVAQIASWVQQARRRRVG